jgi:hypothetical protein
MPYCIRLGIHGGCRISDRTQRANSARRARRLKIFYSVNSLYAFHLNIAAKLLGDPSFLFQLIICSPHQIKKFVRVLLESRLLTQLPPMLLIFHLVRMLCKGAVTRITESGNIKPCACFRQA